MTTSRSVSRDPVPFAHAFATTHWSVVLKAGGEGDDTSQVEAALDHLCRTYWYPIYFFIRRQGHSTHDAQDLTQAFFARLLEKNWIADADQQRGRFRSFLLLVLRRFLAGEWHRANAQKRAGALKCLPLSLDTAETRFMREPADNNTPEQAFEKQWALTLLETALGHLRADYESEGKGEVFESLKPCLAGSRESQPYARLAAELKLTEGAVRVAVHRLRERYRQRIKIEIAHTVGSPEEVDREMRYLFRVLART